MLPNLSLHNFMVLIQPFYNLFGFSCLISDFSSVEFFLLYDLFEIMITFILQNFVSNKLLLVAEVILVTLTIDLLLFLRIHNLLSLAKLFFNIFVQYLSMFNLFNRCSNLLFELQGFFTLVGIIYFSHSFLDCLISLYFVHQMLFNFLIICLNISPNLNISLLFFNFHPFELFISFFFTFIPLFLHNLGGGVEGFFDSIMDFLFFFYDAVGPFVALFFVCHLGVFNFPKPLHFMIGPVHFLGLHHIECK